MLRIFLYNMISVDLIFLAIRNVPILGLPRGPVPDYNLRLFNAICIFVLVFSVGILLLRYILSSPASSSRSRSAWPQEPPD